MLNRHLSTADLRNFGDFFCWALWEWRLLTDPFVTLTSDCNLACIISIQSSVHGNLVCFSAWNSQRQTKESFAAFYRNLSLNQKYWDFTRIQEWIIIEDIFNFFFLSAAFEDDAIAVPVSAAAVASHYWYVLMCAGLSSDKLISADASQSQRNTTAGHFE